LLVVSALFRQKQLQNPAEEEGEEEEEEESQKAF